MDHITSIEIGAGLLVVWLATLFALWKLIDRKGYPGPIRHSIAKDGLMLVHLALLVTGIAFMAKGLSILN